MSLLSWLADKLILCPTTEPIETKHRQRCLIDTATAQVEVWVQQHPMTDGHGRPLTILKFPGTGGRAERAGVHPAEVWSDFSSTIVAVNPTGYGGSGGVPTIKSFPETARSVFEYLMDAGRPIVIVGNSLGCVSALYLAARYPVAGVLLRNPPPIAQMIRTRPRYSWWNFGLSAWVAAEVPPELDAVENAAQARPPCLFVQSEHDRVVPVRYQDMIIERYAGPKFVFRQRQSDHHHQVPEAQYPEYLEALNWLMNEFNT